MRGAGLFTGGTDAVGAEGDLMTGAATGRGAATLAVTVVVVGTGTRPATGNVPAAAIIAGFGEVDAAPGFDGIAPAGTFPAIGFAAATGIVGIGTVAAIWGDPNAGCPEFIGAPGIG